MTKKTINTDLQITFIHQFKRSTRTEWPDKFRVCWYFNPETLDYIYEHKNEMFCIHRSNPDIDSGIIRTPFPF